MNEHSLITSYNEQHPSITAYIEPLKQQAAYPQWSTISSKRSICAIAIAPHSKRMWLATWGGVIAKDMLQDFSYRRYASEHGLCGGNVACICIDSKDCPWVGHVEGGIAYFNGLHWQAYQHLQLQPVHALCASRQQVGIWVALKEMIYRITAFDAPPTLVVTAGHSASLKPLVMFDTGKYLLVGNSFGLYALKENQEPIQIAPELVTSCTALVQDRDGRIWIGTYDGIFMCDDSNQVRGPLLPDEGRMQHVLSLAASRDRLWILTSDGISALVAENWSVPINIPEPTSSIHTLFAYPEEIGVWVGTDQMLAHLTLLQDGEPLWQGNWLPLQPEDHLHNLGRCILPQKYNERVWIGTAGELVSYEVGDKWSINACCGDVRALSTNLTKNGMALWGIIWPGGIGEWRSKGWIDFHQTQPMGLPTALVAGQDGYLYGLVGPALYCFTRTKAQKVANIPTTAVRSLRQTPDGQWWIGTVQGIYRLNRGTWEFAGEQPGPLQSAVRTLEVVGADLWAATENGLWRFYDEKWEAQIPIQVDQLSDVQALAPSKALIGLWLARADGLVLYEPRTQQQLLHYTTANSGLASSRISAVAEIDDVVWLATHAGISCLRLTEKDHEKVKGAIYEYSKNRHI